MALSPADYWHALLRPGVELTDAYCGSLFDRMRAEKLTFGDRVHCPFLRPFFLDEDDERRVKRVAESVAALGERVVAAACGGRPDLLDQVALTPDEVRLVRIDPGYGTASTASRLDAFLLPASLQFAEYNAESPAGLGYAQALAELFDSQPVMARFKERFEARAYRLAEQMLHALLASYREWGGTASPPRLAIVDWREVPTWSEFEILQARFQALGVPTVVCDPRDLEVDGGRLTAPAGRPGGLRDADHRDPRGDRVPIDLVYRRVLINDIVARPAECRALVSAYETGAVCVANTFRCKIPHKKAFFAVLTDEQNDDLFSSAERQLVGEHVPWTRLVRDGRTTRDGHSIDLLEHIGQHRDELVLKPNDEYGGSGVTLGWETNADDWAAARDRALAGDGGAWIVQQRITVRRETFPQFTPAAGVTMREMLVDLAPYLFRGRLAGFLTRLSASGLANVTSGGGQVPSFVVRERAHRT